MTSLTKRMHEYSTIRNFLSQSSGAVKQLTKVAHMLIEKILVFRVLTFYLHS